MANWRWKRELGAFVAMAIAEFATVGINTLYKAAALEGLSYFVFIAYTCVIGTLVLAPLPFIFPRRELPLFQLAIFYRIILVALIGLAGNVCSYKGIEYSSPTLASALGNLTPAFTFVLAIIFRMENLEPRSSTTQFKVIGTTASMTGALVVVLYKGPAILSHASSLSDPSPPLSSFSLKTLQENWIIGGLLLVSSNLLNSFWYIVQAQVLKMYPDEKIVSLLYLLCKTAIAIPICFIAEAKLSDWILRPDIALATIVLSGLFGPSFNTFVSSWVLQLKGPLYASIFKPFSISVAATIGVIFLGDTLFLGSVIGATILLLGFYAVIWGKAEEDDNKCEYDLPDEHSPLLQSFSVDKDNENRTCI